MKTRQTRGPVAAALILAATNVSVAHADPVETVIHSFKGHHGGYTTGIETNGLIVGQSGTLYGTCCDYYSSGRGEVFQLDPPPNGTGKWPEQMLHLFTGSPDGANPSGPLIADAAGNLYGTTSQGGTTTFGGTVFKLAPPVPGATAWTETILYDFTGPDGSTPLGGVIPGPGGVLYGTTFYGGSNEVGTVFQLTPPIAGNGPWTEAVLHNFIGAHRDGSYSDGALIADADGTLYGTTTEGGIHNKGTVFRLVPPSSARGGWTETILYSFRGRADGSGPADGLVADATGALYGTTRAGGSYTSSEGSGTVFKLTPPAAGSTTWTETVLHRFIDRVSPLGVIADSSGALYGALESGGPKRGGVGAVFKLSPPPQGSIDWTETILHQFHSGHLFVGQQGPIFPDSGLIMDADGALYGETQNGGQKHYGGTVYRIVQ